MKEKMVLAYMEWTDTREHRKSKLIINVTGNTSVSVTIDVESLEEVASFKYFAANLSKDGNCNAETSTHITTATMGQPGKDTEEQHQLSYQVQVLQMTGCIHPHHRGGRLGHSWLQQEKGSRR